jgi:TetR/AcrR family transcriptional regulator, mexJK operon transcriptional repressor
VAREVDKAAARGGRPSRADALRLRERILSAATDLFLAEGYGSTSIEAVAARTGVSKRTFYDRFDDKAMLFAAVVHRIIEQVRPPPDVPLILGATLPEMLRHVAGLILHAALTPQAIALHRLIHAESLRFPELVRAVASSGGTGQAIALVSALLARELPNSSLSDENRAFAAQEFINMVVSLPQRRALGFGTPMTPAELESWTDKVVRLFLRGCAGLNT